MSRAIYVVTMESGGKYVSHCDMAVVDNVIDTDLDIEIRTKGIIDSEADQFVIDAANVLRHSGYTVHTDRV